MFFPKIEMSQTVPSGIFSPDAYAAYAESFDLSLLPSDGEVPLSPQSNLSSHTPISALDYIPATIYHDQPLKTEKLGIDEDNLKSEPISDNQSTILNTNSSVLLQQLQKQYQFYPSPLPSPPQDPFNNNNSNYPPSPCPSIEQTFTVFNIKQEYHTLPPSPPESSGAPSSPFSDIKSEPETDTETLIDINSLLEKSFNNFDNFEIKQQPTAAQATTTTTATTAAPPAQDHQLLREYLQDTSFQKKHNLKPLALESLIGGLGVRGDIEPVISLALEHAKRDVQVMCASLKISPDPQQWTTVQVHSWIRSTIEHFKLPQIDDLEAKFPEDGTSLVCLTEEEFHRRAPEAGSTIHAQLEIWKLACTESFASMLSPTGGPSSSNLSISNWNTEGSQNMDLSDDEEEVTPAPAQASTSTLPPNIPTTKTGRTGGSHIHLWQFLKELLASPQTHGTAIRWLDRNKGVFKIEDSVRVAKLWGRRKNRPAMNYDKLSRSIRQYYKKGIMKKTERSQRLVYQFCHPYCL